jgi:hypothetical protein
MEAGSNTSTVTLRVVGGDEKVSAWEYTWATLFLGDLSTGTRPSRHSESQIWESKMWSRVPWQSDLRMAVLARASRNCNPHVLCAVVAVIFGVYNPVRLLHLPVVTIRKWAMNPVDAYSYKRQYSIKLYWNENLETVIIIQELFCNYWEISIYKSNNF